RPGVTIGYYFLDKHDNLHPAHPIRIVRERGTNLVSQPDRPPRWRFVPGSGSFKTGENLDPAWSLEGETTLFLMSGSDTDGGSEAPAGTATLEVPGAGELFALRQ